MPNYHDKVAIFDAIFDALGGCTTTIDTTKLTNNVLGKALGHCSGEIWYFEQFNQRSAFVDETVTYGP